MNVKMFSVKPYLAILNAMSSFRPDPLSGLPTNSTINAVSNWYTKHLEELDFNPSKVAVIHAGVDRTWRHDDLVAWLKRECEKKNVTVSSSQNGKTLTVVFFEDDNDALTFYLTWHTGENQHEIA